MLWLGGGREMTFHELLRFNSIICVSGALSITLTWW